MKQRNVNVVVKNFLWLIFVKKGTGYRNICNDCLKRESGATDKFKDFSSRELIDELKARGYEGQLIKKVVETIKL